MTLQGRDRRRVGELIALYQLESRETDVVVEGPSDADLVRWFLRCRELRGTMVRPIEEIEIEPALLAKHSCPDNHRGRVTALALEVEEALGPGSHQLTCVVDADFDVVLRRPAAS